MIETLLLDWSGTLADDLAATLAATNEVLAAHGRPPLDREAFQREFELPFMRFYERLLPGCSREAVDRAFFAAYEPLRGSIPLLPGVRCLLALARDAGMQVHLFSTMRQDLLEGEVARHDLSPWLHGVHGGVEDKRQALPGLLARLGAAPDTTLFVGDTVHDVEAARAAGCRSAAVATGYAHRERLAAAGPDHLCDHLPCVAALLARERAVEELAMPIATVGGLVVADDGEILLVRTRKWSNRWGMPGGKIEYGETMEAAFLREVEEETGLVLTDPEVVLVQEAVLSPEFHRPRHFLLINLRGRAHSKAVRLNYEAQAYRWVRPEEALAMELNEPTRHLIERVYGDGARTAAGADHG
ncbi:MAG: NUDIX domain-containing protein [Nitrospirae bacterium]|nr:MAG: NUDIX domain-containing protein [Nitrospirota bacterium]